MKQIVLGMRSGKSVEVSIGQQVASNYRIQTVYCSINLDNNEKHNSDYGINKKYDLIMKKPNIKLGNEKLL